MVAAAAAAPLVAVARKSLVIGSKRYSSFVITFECAQAEILFFITAGIKRKLSRKETDRTELLEMIERLDNRAEEKF